MNPPDISPPPAPLPAAQPDMVSPRGGAWKLAISWCVIPPLLLCLAELALRLAGYGMSTQLFVPVKLDGDTLHAPNRLFFQQFYGVPITRVPHEFAIPSQKPPNTFRIFVFGSSAAQGYPSPDFAFWRVLDTMLHARGGGMNTEMYSVALGGSDSHVMRAAAKACAQFEPDLFLVYMGNNELNPRVVQTLFWDRLPAPLALRCLHLTAALNDLRLVQLLRNLKPAAAQNGPQGGAKGGRDTARAYQYYQANVNDICAFAKQAGARVLLCTVGTRLRDCVPADRDGDAPAPWRDAWNSGNALCDQGRFREALAEYARARALGGDHAPLAYATACCLHGLGEYDAARREFVLARDLDGNHNRACSRINEVLKTTAAARARDGVELLDAVQAFSADSPHGIEGPELFVDHVHLSAEGNHVLARSVLETLARMEPRLEITAPALSAEECRKRLGMSLPDLREELLCTLGSGEWTGIQPSERLKGELARLDEQIGPHADEMRLEACTRAADLVPWDVNVRTKCVRLTLDKETALKKAQALAADFPRSAEAFRLLARGFRDTGRPDDAVGAMQRATTLLPNDPEAQAELGRLCLAANRTEDAFRAFAASQRLKASAQAECGIGRVLLRQGNVSGATQAFTRAMRRKPEDPSLLEEAVLALCDVERLDAARSAMALWTGLQAAPGPAPSQADTEAKEKAMAGWPEGMEPCDTRLSVLRQLFRTIPFTSYGACRFQTLFLEEAARLKRAGDGAGAAEACRTAFPMNPANAQPAQDLGAILADSSPAERLRVWESVWKNNGENAHAVRFLAAARAAAGDIASAREALDTLRRLAPDDWSGCVLTGDAFAAAGAWNDAASAYEQALAVNPGLDYVKSRLADARGRASAPNPMVENAVPAPPSP